MNEPRTMDIGTGPVDDDVNGAEQGEPRTALTTADIAAGTVDPPDRSVEAPAAPAARDTRSQTTPEADGSAAPFFDQGAASELRGRWNDIQGGFVDEPRTAVQQADELVAEAVKRLVDGFASQRQSLETQWSSGGEASTEDLRLALRRYRSFFDRLLSI